MNKEDKEISKINKEMKIYIFLGVLSFIIFNIGMLVFNYQRLFGNNGEVNVINMTGCIVHLMATIASGVFLYYRIKE